MSERASVGEAVIAEIAAVVSPDGVRTDSETLETYGRDWTRVHAPQPCAIVFPRSTDEVSRVLAICDRERLAVVPSGGRTGLAGGAVAAAGELVLSLARMHTIHPVDVTGMTVRVEAGAITERVHESMQAFGLTWPVDFASKGSSQVGGNIATNAGGVKVIRYGLTRQWVLGLTVVLADGEILELNGALEKNNTGIDLRQLFIGSEGILGVITEAVLKLTRLPGHLDVFLFGVSDLRAVMRLFEAARRGPFEVMAFEMFSDLCLARLARHRGLRAPLERKTPYYVLLEVEAPHRDRLDAWLEQVLEDALVEDGTLAASAEQARALWALREGISESLSATGFPHKNDVSLPVSAVPAFSHELEAIFETRYPDWEICVFGHIGDGNLHVNVMKPEQLSKEAFLEHVHDADRALFEVVARHRGSISAEHGVGLLKREFLGYSRTEREIALMRQLKAQFDPHGILNPGKVL